MEESGVFYGFISWKNAPVDLGLGQNSGETQIFGVRKDVLRGFQQLSDDQWHCNPIKKPERIGIVAGDLRFFAKEHRGQNRFVRLVAWVRPPKVGIPTEHPLEMPLVMQLPTWILMCFFSIEKLLRKNHGDLKDVFFWSPKTEITIWF